MPRKATTSPREPASLPEVPIPLSEVPEHQRGAYQVALIENPDELRAALSQEDFFPMIGNFPSAWWDRMSLYLYRRPDDEGRMVKNDGPRKYVPGGVLRQAVDEEFISRKWGGGKYTLYLKLDSKETIREHTFVIDGPPKVLPGQYVEIEGKAVSLAGTTTPPAAPPEENNNAKVIEAITTAQESGMKILEHASTTALDMVKEQAKSANTPAPANPLQDKLMELLVTRAFAPAATPVPNPLQDKLMEIVVERAFKEPAEPARERETPLDEAIGMVQQVTGKTLPEILKGTKANPESEYGWVGPLANVALQALAQLPALMREAREARQLEFERAVYLRTLQPGQPPQLPATTAAARPGPQAVPATQPPTAPTKEQVIQAIVNRICQGFDRHRDTGGDIAAAISVEFGEHIEAMGLEKALYDQETMTGILMQQPQLAAALAQRSSHAKWAIFADEYQDYMEERWGGAEEDDGGEPEAETGKPPAA